MPARRFRTVAFALLLLSIACALVLASTGALDFVAAWGPIAAIALGLSAMLIAGTVALRLKLREARWDAGHRLR